MSKLNPNQKGFTLTELSIALAMLSVLLIIILMSILNIIGTYNKGVTLKRVNQSGRSIVADLQTDLRKSVSTGGGIGERYDKDTAGNPALTGICTGYDSYIWNLYKDGVLITNLKFNDASAHLISFVKITDPGGQYCKKAGAPVAYPIPTEANSSVLVDDGLVIDEPIGLERGYNNQLLRFTFTISTENQGSGGNADISGGVCSGGGDNNFCALNTFVVTSYAKGI